jgi:hypothetical protein
MQGYKYKNRRRFVTVSCFFVLYSVFYVKAYGFSQSIKMGSLTTTQSLLTLKSNTMKKSHCKGSSYVDIEQIIQVNKYQFNVKCFVLASK